MIKKLSEISKTDVAIAGGKGANLGELLGKGFPVPPGFVVTAAAYRDFLQTIPIGDEIRKLTVSSQSQGNIICESIQDKIKKTELNSNLKDEILTAHRQLAEHRGDPLVCVVRSSATAEDSGEASFAGQHKTYYYVDEANLLTMIKHCWASLWSPEAVSYRATQGIDHITVFMAVVVQEMILSEISGITFTVNPVTGSKEEIVIEASWGMGAAIVDGRVSPDRFTIDRSQLKLMKKHIADKRFMVSPAPTIEKEERLIEVPHDLRKQETLTIDQVKAIAKWAIRSEAHFGCPQDVEWAISGGQFYMLQSRPVTVMGHEDIGKGIRGRYVLFKPIIENFTDPLTPLTADMVIRALPPGFRVIKGWVYADLKIFNKLVPLKLSDKDLADLLYLGANIQSMKLRPSLTKLPFFLGFALFFYLKVGVLFARIRRMPDDFMEIYRQLCQKVEADINLTPHDAFLRIWSRPKILDPIGYHVLTANLFSVRHMVGSGILERLLQQWLPDLRKDASALLSSGIEGVLSAEIGRGIWALAQTAKASPRVCELLLKHKPDKALADIRSEPSAKDFLAQLECFLAKNGHRGLKEIEIKSPRWEEDPSPVLGMIRNNLTIESDPMAYYHKTSCLRVDIETEIHKGLEKYPLEQLLHIRWRLLRYLIKEIRYAAKLRENSRFYHIMAFYVCRKKILKIESDFIRQGKLKCKDDIFYLYLDEMAQMQQGHLDWQAVEKRIRERRIEHIRLFKTIPPKAIGVTISEKPSTDRKKGNVLHGQSASPGSYEGVAHVILDPLLDMELKPGEVLVAPYTDPAWTPLFLTAGAAVVEVGSYLSHAGTIAREYGMPCVVDVPNCTERIQTGFRVRVDGNSGWVHILTENRGDTQ